MKILNLNDIYDFLSGKELKNEIDVPDEVFEIFEIFRKAESAYQSKSKYHNAYYSLDRNDGIELLAIQKVKTPEEILIEKETQEQLLHSVFSLADKQAQRVYAYFYLDMSVTEIAKVENVDRSSVSESIYRGINNLKKMYSAPQI